MGAPTTFDSQRFDSYLPVYDAVPEKWEDARPFIVEQLKQMSNAINIREIGWFLDEELLSGKQFVPSATNTTGTQGQFRTVLRYTLNVGPLVNGTNTRTVPIVFNANFTLVDLWVAATNTSTFTAQLIFGSNVILSASGLTTTVTITSPGAFNIGWLICEFLQEP
jgi:hypothetical protein